MDEVNIEYAQTDIRKVPFSYFEIPSTDSESEIKKQISCKAYELVSILYQHEYGKIGFILPSELSQGYKAEYIALLCQKKYSVNCTVSQQYSNCLFMIRVPQHKDTIVLPLAVQNISLMKILNNTAELSWEAPAHNGADISYYSVESEDDICVTTETTSCTLSNLIPNKLYSIYINAVSGNRNGIKSNFRFITKRNEDVGKLYYWGKLNLMNNADSKCCVYPTYYAYGSQIVASAASTLTNFYAIAKDGSMLEQESLNNIMQQPYKLPIGKVRQISCGNHYAFAVTYAGMLYAWGNNGDGALGFGNDKLEFNEPTHLNVDNQFVLQISANQSTSVCLTSNYIKNRVYVWGILPNHKTPLVISDELSPAIQEYYPVQLNDTEINGNPTSVHASLFMYYIVTNQNNIYPVGYSKEGMTGLGKDFCNKYISHPSIKINFPINGTLVSFSAGHSHCLAIVEGADLVRHVYGWGLNNSNQCTPEDKKYIYSPEENTLCPLKPSKSEAGSYHSMILTETGEVYTFGSTEYGCLGTTSEYGDKRISKPTKVNILNGLNVSNIIACNSNSYAIVAGQ